MRFPQHLVVYSVTFSLLVLSFFSVAEPRPFSFQVISDIPYNDDQEHLLVNKIMPALHKAPAPFLMHLGDIKSGGTPCTNALILRRLHQVKSMHPTATFYTPGDNEWTDCDNKSTGAPVSELEKYDLIRQFYRENLQHYPKEFKVRSQPLYPENKQWFYSNVAFATLHIVGSNNGRSSIAVDDEPMALSQIKARDAANKYWLDDVFNQAKNTNASAIIIGFQADVTDNAYSKACNDNNPTQCNGFYPFIKQLSHLAANFKKPVLVMHGDTSPYCLDNSLAAKVGVKNAKNLWRFNSAGDYKVLDAVTVNVDVTNSKTPFSMTTLLTNETPLIGCK